MGFGHTASQIGKTTKAIKAPKASKTTKATKSGISIQSRKAAEDKSKDWDEGLTNTEEPEGSKEREKPNEFDESKMSDASEEPEEDDDDIKRINLLSNKTKVTREPRTEQIHRGRFRSAILYEHDLDLVSSKD